MKFMYILFASMLLVSSAYSNILQDFQQDIVKVEQDLQNTFQSGWLGSLLGNTVEFLKDALSDLEGAKCIINDVIKIDETAVAIPKELQSCGLSIKSEYAAVQSAVKDIETSAENVKSLMQQYCGSWEAITSKTCYNSVFSNLVELAKKGQLILQGLQSVPQSEECILNAVDSLVSVLEQFPSAIQTCAENLKV